MAAFPDTMATARLRWHKPSGSPDLLADPEIDIIHSPLPNHLHVPFPR
ncbi:MAG: hypothetical protein ACK41U_17730 [Paracoccus sp. (in: a-proteobacteria)]